MPIYLSEDIRSNLRNPYIHPHRFRRCCHFLGAFIFFGGAISLAHRIERGCKTWKHWKHQKQCVDEFLRDSQGGGGKTLDISVDGVTS